MYYTPVVLLDAVGRVGYVIFNHPTAKKSLRPTKMHFVGRVGRHPTQILVR